MPRVYQKTKSARGATRTCGRCGATIKPGDLYFQWSFRYGGTHYRCAQHRPRQSELTQSKMATVYEAIESATDQLDKGATTVDEVRELVQGVAETVQEVAEEYREAAEPFGGAGENADRADELEGWASELEDFDPDEPESEVDTDAIEAQMRADGFSPDDEAEWTSVLDARTQEAEAEDTAGDEAVEAAREQAHELLGGCPL